ncbi:MAG: hypothetical protein ABIE94_03815, partial [archaeon]
ALDGCEFVQGDRMWFCSAREGYTGVNFFIAQRINNEWKNPVYAGDKLMKEYQMGEMHITADGKELYYHSGREGTKGQFDIWVSKRTDTGWGEPENVEKVNTPENEGWPFITQDGKELWFTRFYKGSPAIFRTRRTGEKWGEPELIVSQFAGEASLDAAGNLYFTHHYYKDGVMLEADIYVAYKK